jgi:hypothetical protein
LPEYTMRTVLPFLGVVTFVGVLAPSASATPLTLQYDVTVTRLCDFATGSCSNVNIGGLELTVTTDDTILFREYGPSSSTAHFGPTTVAIDTSALGFFPAPFVPDVVVSFRSSSTTDYEALDTHEASLGTSITDLRLEHSDEPFEDDFPPELQYSLFTMLSGGERPHAADGVPEDPTSADVRASLARDFRFYYQVWAAMCIDTLPCDIDPRAFEAFGTATFREQIAPVPEPATLSLLSLGLLAGAAARRLRQSRV